MMMLVEAFLLLSLVGHPLYMNFCVYIYNMLRCTQEPKPKPKPKPVTSGRKSWSQPRTSLFSKAFVKTQNKDTSKNSSLTFDYVKSEDKIIRIYKKTLWVLLDFSIYKYARKMLHI